MTALPPGIERVAQATAASPLDPAALCAAVDGLLRPVTKHALCTVNSLDVTSLRLTRVYSSDPVAYPAGGTKDKRGLPWGQHVLIDKRIFIGEGAQAIRASFDDAVAIEALRLRSIVNVPVVEAGTCLGTVNILLHQESVTPELVELATLAALLIVPALRAREA